MTDGNAPVARGYPVTSGPYKGPMTVDASLLHALWCYGILSPVTGVVYSYGTHQKALDDADKLIYDRAQRLAASSSDGSEAADGAIGSRGLTDETHKCQPSRSEGETTRSAGVAPGPSEAELREALRRVRSGSADAEADIMETFRTFAHAQPPKLTDEERHAIGHARYQAERATPEFPELCFDYELILTLLRIIDRLTDRLGIAQKIIAEYKASTTAGAKADVAAHGMPGARGQAISDLAAGMKAAMEIVGEMRQSEAGLFDPMHSGQRGEDRSNALYDAYCAIRRASQVTSTLCATPAEGE